MKNKRRTSTPLPPLPSPEKTYQRRGEEEEKTKTEEERGVRTEEEGGEDKSWTSTPLLSPLWQDALVEGKKNERKGK